MTILTEEGIKTQYHLPTRTLTRIINNKLCSVELREHDSVSDLARFSHLTDESFESLSQVQKELKSLKDAGARTRP